MNPHIRYQQPYPNTNSYKLSSKPYNQTSTQQNNVQQSGDNRSLYRKMSQQIVYESDLTRHKSINNRDIKPYISGSNNNLLPYRLQGGNNNNTVNNTNNNNNNNSQSSLALTGKLPVKQQQQSSSSHYRTTHNFYRGNNNIEKSESANDFFNQVASQISTQQPKMQKVISQTFNQPVYVPTMQKQPQSTIIPQQQPLTTNTNRNVYSSQQITYKKQKNNIPDYDQYQDNKDCSKCIQLQNQMQKIFKFMREQLEISVKQHTDRMNKIIIEQAKEILDLRKMLINNQKGIININKQQYQQSIIYSQNNNNNNKYSPSSKSQLKSKSPSKLSLTKSNTSISPHLTNKQKITMVSKQLSPSKTFNMNRQKYGESNNQITNNKMVSTAINSTKNILLLSQNITVEQLSLKIKTLQQKMQLSFKLQTQRNQKAYIMSKRVQIIQKGLVKIFASKLQRVKQTLKTWLIRQQDKQNNLYKELKVVSSRVGTMSQPNTLLNTHSSPLIPQPVYQQSNSPQLSTHKMTIRMKKFSSQVQDLREILTNLSTKQFKYDNYQIESLTEQIASIRQKVSQLDKAKYQISNKLIETEQKIDQAIEQSRHSKISSNHSNGGYSSKQIQRESNSRGIDREVSSSSSVLLRRTTSNNNNNCNNNNNMNNSNSNMNNMNKNNSVQLIYGNNNGSNISNNSNNSNRYSNDMGTRSMRVEQYPSKSINYGSKQKQTKNTKFQSQNSQYKNNYYQPHSHSEYKGYANQQSQYSHYTEGNNSKIGYKNNNNNSNNNNSKNNNNNNNNNTNRLNQYDDQQQQQEGYNNNNQQQIFSNSSSQYNQNDQRQDQHSYQQQQMQDQEDEFFYPVGLQKQQVNGMKLQKQQVNDMRVSASNKRMGNNNYDNNINNNNNNNNKNKNKQQQQEYPSPTIHRFMQVIQYRQQVPLKVQIDQTGYIKSAQNGMYIVDRNMDGFDLNIKQLDWLKRRGIIIVEH